MKVTTTAKKQKALFFVSGIDLSSVDLGVLGANHKLFCVKFCRSQYILRAKILPYIVNTFRT